MSHVVCWKVNIHERQYRKKFKFTHFSYGLGNNFQKQQGQESLMELVSGAQGWGRVERGGKG